MPTHVCHNEYTKLVLIMFHFSFFTQTNCFAGWPAWIDAGCVEDLVPNQEGFGARGVRGPVQVSGQFGPADGVAQTLHGSNKQEEVR